MKAALLATIALALLLVPTAGAHANLYQSDPGPGARLASAPSRVSVVLSERVDESGSGLEVLDTSGARVDEGDVKIENGPNPRVSVSLPADLPDGAYRLHWFAFSAVDQHTTQGIVGFAVGGFEPPGSQEASLNNLDAVAIFARAIQYAGFALAFGALAFLFFVERAPDRARLQQFRIGLVAGAALHLVGLLILADHTRAQTRLSWSAFFDGDVGGIILYRLIADGLALLLALVPLHRAPLRPWSFALLVPWLGAALGSARFGHASQEGLFAILIDFVHVVAIAAWLGGVAFLLAYLLAAARRGDAIEAVREDGLRFSRLAVACVTLVAITGVLLTTTILGWSVFLHPLEHIRTAWFQALVGKILLAVTMVLVASINRYVFLEAEEGPSRGLGRIAHRFFQRFRRRSFASFVAFEATLGAAVLVLAAILTSVGAPSGSSDAGPAPLRLTATSSSFNGLLEIAPTPQLGGSGKARFYITEAATGAPVENDTCGRQGCLTLYLTYGAARRNLTPEEEEELEENAESRVLTPESDGWWFVDNLLFAQAGEARIRVVVQTAYVYQEELLFAFNVAGTVATPTAA